MTVKTPAAPAVITPKTVSVEKMNPAVAAEIFQRAMLAVEYMKNGAQGSVNADFDSEIPARQAGKDVDGRPIAGSVKTRAQWDKLSRQIEKAYKLASSVAAVAK